MLSSEENQLLEALERYRERFEWFCTGRAPEAGLETDEVKMVLAVWDEEVEPRRGRIKDPLLKQAFEGLLVGIEKGRARVRLMFLIALQKLVEARFLWLMAEMALKAPAEMKQTLSDVSPENREKLLEIARKTLGTDFDAATMFRDMMQIADDKEQQWQKSLDEIKKEWEEEFNAEMEVRLLKIDAPQAAFWMAELIPQMAAIQKQHPELA